MIVAFNLDSLSLMLQRSKISFAKRELIYRSLKETLIFEHAFEGASTLRDLQTTCCDLKRSEAAVKANRTRKRVKKGAAK